MEEKEKESTKEAKVDNSAEKKAKTTKKTTKKAETNKNAEVPTGKEKKKTEAGTKPKTSKTAKQEEKPTKQKQTETKKETKTTKSTKGTKTSKPEPAVKDVKETKSAKATKAAQTPEKKDKPKEALKTEKVAEPAKIIEEVKETKIEEKPSLKEKMKSFLKRFSKDAGNQEAINKEEKPTKKEKPIKDKKEPKKEKSSEEKKAIREEQFIKQVILRKRKTLIILASAIVIVLTLAVFSTGFALANINNPGIVSGITVNGRSLHGLNREEATRKISEDLNADLEREIAIKAGEFETIISPSQIEARFNIDEIVDEVYHLGRNGNIFSNNFAIMHANLFGRDFEPVLIYDEELLEDILMDIAVRLPGAMEEPRNYVEGNNLLIVRGIPGVSIGRSETRTLILDEIANNTGEDIELSLIEVLPRPIDIYEIHEEIYREPRNAHYTEEPLEIFVHIYGVNFDIEEAKSILEEDQDEYIIPLTITTPEITINMLGERAFPDRLSTFSTRYDATNIPRTRNLELISDRLDEIVVMPGEVFSFNQRLGRRTAAAGFREAPRIC